MLQRKIVWLKPHFVFLFLGFTLGYFYLTNTPPLQSPDEFQHFRRTWQISTGRFLEVRENNRVGGYFPKSLEDFERPFDQIMCSKERKYSKETQNALLKMQENNELVFKDFPSVASYSALSYLPQALCMSVLRARGYSLITAVNAARATVFLIWLISMFFVIRLIPIGKWLITLLALLPTQLYISASFSADTVTNILSFWFLALVLHHAFSEHALTWKDLFVLFVIIALLALAKVVYVSLGLLLLAIPAEKFGSQKAKTITFLSLMLPALALAALWTTVAIGYYIPSKEYNPDWVFFANPKMEANYFEQKEFLAANPLQIFRVIYHTFSNEPQFCLKSYVGLFGVYLDLPIPEWAWRSAILFILVISLLSGAEKRLTLILKLILLLTFMVSTTLVILAQYMVWCAPGSPGPDVIQGRYLIPLFPVLLLALNTRLTYRKYLISYLVMGGTVFFNVLALFLLNERYIAP